MQMTHRGGKWRLGVALVALLTLCATVLFSAPAVAEPVESSNPSNPPLTLEYKCLNRDFVRAQRFLKCLDKHDVLVHQDAFVDIANRNGGVRTSGTTGYDESVDYVAEQLEAAGLSPTRQAFLFSSYLENSVSLSADGVPLDTRTMSYSGSGIVMDGNPIGVDLDLGLGNTSTSGCEASDFDGLDMSGDADVAVIQRGACFFSDKAVNAVNAGAEAVIIFNQGNTEDRKENILGTLGNGVIGIVDIPVLSTSYDDGLVLLGAESVDVAADTTITVSETENLFVDIAGVNPDNIVMVGAHLDSVPTGPGIQDNGSGSGVILAVALEMARNSKYVPQNTLRFAWWGAEEFGLLGSNYSIEDLFFNDPEELAKIALYLNFDMIASPNFYYGVYDADQSTFEATAPIPPGSEAVEDVFEAFYSERNIPYDDSEFSGRSDYAIFLAAGIPAGGLFTGAEQQKTAEQAAIWGGHVGRQFDPCYHLACDTWMSHRALHVNVDAVGYAVFHFAADTSAVNGVAGVEVVGRQPSDVRIDGAQGTFAGGGGGLSPDHDDHDHEYDREGE